MLKWVAKYLLNLCTCGMIILTVATIALGRPHRIGVLPDKGENFGCLTCHITPGGELNAFGKDYGAIAIEAGDQFVEAIKKLDSDGDGFSNEEEFATGKNPGIADLKTEHEIDTQKEQAGSEQPVKYEQDKEPKPKEAKLESKTYVQEKQAIAIQPKDTELKQDKSINIKSILYKFARYSALAGYLFIFIQYVLSSRIRLIEKRMGLDKLFSIHRKTGVLGLILVLSHPTLLFVSNNLQGYSLLLKVAGLFALLILLTIAGVAILYAKLNLKYETWKNIHKASYLILPVAFVHSIFLGSDLHGWSPMKILWLALASIYIIILIYKVWNWFYVRRHPFSVVDVVQETHDTWSLYFTDEHLDYKPGQFMIIRLARNGKVSEPHPFTISSSPTRNRLSISVKSVGDFTSTIGDTKVSDVAYIDAPYGIFSFLNHDAHDLIFIAGGIGITPFISMLRYIYDKKLDKDVILIWANKTENDIAFRDELEKMANEMPSLKVIHVMSKQDDWSGEKGYVDAEKIKHYVRNLQNSQFFICGPPQMMILVKKALRNLGVTKRRIHYEKFALR